MWWWTVSLGWHMQHFLVLKHHDLFLTVNWFKIPDHIHHDPNNPADTFNLQDIGRGLCVSWGAGSAHMRLYGTAWTYICGCGNTLDVFNHSCYAVMTFIVQVQLSFQREICSQWQIVSLTEHSYHLFGTSLLYVSRLFQGHFLLHLPQLAMHCSCVFIVKTK